MKIYNKLRLVLYRVQLKKVYKEAPKSILESALFPKNREIHVNTSGKSILETAGLDRGIQNNYMKKRNAEIEKSRQKIRKIETKINRLK